MASNQIRENFITVLLQEEYPSHYFERLREEGNLSPWFIELEQLIGVEQNPEYHPEGDVWNHTMLVIDAAAKMREQAREPLEFMLAAVCHDFGKYTATAFIKGKIRSYGHETEGLPMTERFLRRMEMEDRTIKQVLNLVEYHMKPNLLARQNSKVKSTNRLFRNVYVPEDLILLSKADFYGKQSKVSYDDTEKYLRDRLEIYRMQLKKI